MNRTELLATSIATAKNEIIADVQNGDVPKNVKSFSHLHDFVDANLYGNVCEEGFPQKFESSADWYAFVDEVQYAIDAWIKSGLLRTAVASLKA